MSFYGKLKKCDPTLHMPKEYNALPRIGVVIENLWREKVLLDYTIIVQGHEFRAHKLVLASTSHYFRTLLTSNFAESQEDKIELKALTPVGMKILLEYVYSGKTTGVDISNYIDVISAAEHLQVKGLVAVCCDFMLGTTYLDIQKKFEMFQVAKYYPLGAVIEEVMKDRVKKDIDKIFIGDSFKEVPIDHMILLPEIWDGEEIALFNFFEEWVYHKNAEERIASADKLMENIRFCLMHEHDLMLVSRSKIYCQCRGTKWVKLVEEAYRFKEIPVWLKVHEKRKQAELRGEKKLIAFTSHPDRSTLCGTEFHDLELERVKYRWKRFQSVLEAGGLFWEPSSVVVENHLLIAGGDLPDFTGTSNKCYIFDPIETRWRPIKEMQTSRSQFPLVEYREKVVAIGGCNRNIGDESNLSATGMCETYDFSTNTWSPFPRLPTALRQHAACNFFGTIYVTGGLTDSGETWTLSKSVYIYESSSKTWREGPPMKRARYGHSIFPMFVENEHAIIVLGRLGTFDYFIPRLGLWKKYNFEPRRGHPKPTPAYGCRVSDGTNSIHVVSCKSLGETSAARNIGGHNSNTYCFTMTPDKACKDYTWLYLTEREQTFYPMKTHFAAFLKLVPSPSDRPFLIGCFEGFNEGGTRYAEWDTFGRKGIIISEKELSSDPEAEPFD